MPGIDIGKKCALLYLDRLITLVRIIEVISHKTVAAPNGNKYWLSEPVEVESDSVELSPSLDDDPFVLDLH